MRAEKAVREHAWLDSDAGPVVRPYAVTQGRVSPTGRVDVVAYVVATAGAAPPSRLQPEHLAIVAAAGRPIPVAELASRIDLPLGAIRVLLGDLRSAGLVSLYEPPAATRSRNDVLKAVVHGLRAR
jgi:DNA-binding transcriptional ArsR family regulator